jgi:hypothetical protein
LNCFFIDSGTAPAGLGEVAEADVEELFAVELMPGVKCPRTIGPSSPEIVDKITFDPEVRPLSY